MRNSNNVQKVFTFLGKINIDNFRLLDFIAEEDITENLTFDRLTELIENNDGFCVDIIYYSAAIEFLAKNDPSLVDSLTLASELGYYPKDLNSEILASILASDMLRNDWYKAEDEITEFLNEIEWS